MLEALVWSEAGIHTKRSTHALQYGIMIKTLNNLFIKREGRNFWDKISVKEFVQVSFNFRKFQNLATAANLFPPKHHSIFSFSIVPIIFLLVALVTYKFLPYSLNHLDSSKAHTSHQETDKNKGTMIVPSILWLYLQCQNLAPCKSHPVSRAHFSGDEA